MMLYERLEQNIVGDMDAQLTVANEVATGQQEPLISTVDRREAIVADRDEGHGSCSWLSWLFKKGFGETSTPADDAEARPSLVFATISLMINHAGSYKGTLPCVVPNMLCESCVWRAES